MFSVFQALGLKVGIHPILENKEGSLGGLSAKKLMQDPTAPREGDFAENCLKNLAAISKGNEGDEEGNPLYDDQGRIIYIPRNRCDSYKRRADRDEHATIVGTEMHSPKFYESYEDDDWLEVRSKPLDLQSHPASPISREKNTRLTLLRMSPY